jgi:knotted carbamoyltransferase YgeW
MERIPELIEKVKGLNVDLHHRDYLRTWDFSDDELKSILHTAEALQTLHENGRSIKSFPNGGLGVSIFRDKSTRTRFSYASATSLLGLTVSELDEEKSQIAHGETVRETANMISFATQAIGIRDDLFIGEGHKYMCEVSEAVQEGYEKGVLSEKPVVVNLQCDEDHPTQSMSDLIQLAEHFGGLENLKGKKMAMTWAYSPSYGKPLSVPQGLITLMTRFGMKVHLAHPEGYDLLPEVVDVAKKTGNLTMGHSMEEAFKDADVVYPKSWAPYTVMEKRRDLLRGKGAGKEAMASLEKECLLNNKKYVGWECDEKKMKLAKESAVYMHCLPADITGVSCEHGEVSKEVFEKFRLFTYREASHKCFVIASAILHGRFANVGGLLAEHALTTPFRPVPLLRKSGDMDAEIRKLSIKYLPLACEILKEVVRIPEDHIEEDPRCGMSNHEGPRLEYLRKAIVEAGAVEDPADVWFDEFGNIVWTVEDKSDKNPKKIVYFDGHTDTVAHLPDQWKTKIGEGIDVFRGVTDPEKVDIAFMRKELGYMLEKEEWKHLIFGRGTADQLSGVIAQVVATKILLELKDMGSLDGVKVMSYGTAAEEDNDGGGPMFVMRTCSKELLPDVVIHTEGTGDKNEGACGVYFGQRGRMQIEVNVIGKSSHGSMPWEGLNPLEYGSMIIHEANEKYEKGEGFLDDEFLGRGTRTASDCRIETPSDCAVPATFSFRFDRRLTVGEVPEQAIEDIRNLDAVKKAEASGLRVDVSAPLYEQKTWTGCVPSNPQIYRGWKTPLDHGIVPIAVESYDEMVKEYPFECKDLPRKARVSRWIFSTDGVGYFNLSDDPTREKEGWIDHHPPMLGIGIGFEQNTHKLGEFIDSRHFPAAIGFMAKFPSLFAKQYKP